MLSDTSRPTIPQEDFHDYLKQWTQKQLAERKAAHDLKRLSGQSDMVEPLTLPIVPLRLSVIPRVPPLKGCMLTRWMMELVLLVEGVTLSGISPSLKRHTASVSGVVLLCVLSLKTVSLAPCVEERDAPTYPLLEGFIDREDLIFTFNSLSSIFLPSDRIPKLGGRTTSKPRRRRRGPFFTSRTLSPSPLGACCPAKRHGHPCGLGDLSTCSLAAACHR